jgi:hypothetical protein
MRPVCPNYLEEKENLPPSVHPDVAKRVSEIMDAAEALRNAERAKESEERRQLLLKQARGIAENEN